MNAQLKSTTDGNFMNTGRKLSGIMRICDVLKQNIS